MLGHLITENGAGALDNYNHSWINLKYVEFLPDQLVYFSGQAIWSDAKYLTVSLFFNEQLKDTRIPKHDISNCWWTNCSKS